MIGIQPAVVRVSPGRRLVGSDLGVLQSLGHGVLGGVEHGLVGVAVKRY